MTLRTADQRVAAGCPGCGGSLRATGHLEVVAAYTGNVRECVTSARVSYCGAVAPERTPDDPKDTLRWLLIALDRAQGNINLARADVLGEPPSWRHRVLMALADTQMYIGNAAARVRGETL